MKRYKLVCQYDGANFSGWQLQNDNRTVQGELEKVLTKLNKGELVRVIGSGRTYAGVHALGQVAHFDMSTKLKINDLKKAINGNLHEDCYVNFIELVDEEFHARFSASQRSYIYSCRQNRYLLDRNKVWNTGELDILKLNNAAKILIGEHDFLSFSKKNPKMNDTISIIYQSEWKENGQIVNYHISGNRFLHHMVRYLVGSMVAISQGKYSIEQLIKELDNPKSDSKQFKAPAYGLVLNYVSYE